jgi:hypothetical protein
MRDQSVVERLAIARVLVGLAKEMHRLWETTHKPFGTEIDLVFVGACVAIGDFDGQPMTASNIANYISMPRATVDRKLALLVERGVIRRNGTRYLLVERSAEDIDEYLDRATKLMAKAGKRIRDTK